MPARAAELLAACAAAPDDDEPRAVWADAIGGERGELVALQLRLARGGAAPEIAALVAREAELLAAHGDAWAGVAALRGPTEIRARWERGFVEALHVSARVFGDRGARILAAAPLARGLALGALLEWDGPDGMRERLARCVAQPGFERIARLDLGPLQNEADAPPAAAAALALLAASGTLFRLRGLALGALDASALRVLVDAGPLPNLAALAADLAADLALPELVAALPSLSHLAVRTPAASAELATSLPAGLRSLALVTARGHGDELRLLRAAPCAPQLRALRVAGGMVRGPADDLLAMRELRALDLSRVYLSDRPRLLDTLRAMPHLETVCLPGPVEQVPGARFVVLAPRDGEWKV